MGPTDRRWESIFMERRFTGGICRLGCPDPTDFPVSIRSKSLNIQAPIKLASRAQGSTARPGRGQKTS
jgi:hypothetical protein